MQSQYDGDLEKVPVGLVDFSLPRDVMHNYWKSKENWEAFRDDLLKHLMKGQPKLRSKSGTAQDGLILEGLDFKTIDVTNKEFERFRLSLDSPDDILPILSVCCSERNVSSAWNDVSIIYADQSSAGCSSHTDRRLPWQQF